MRAARRLVPDPKSTRLRRARVGDRTELYTESVGELPSVYGERWVHFEGRAYRTFEPGRSKLSAGLVHGWVGPLPLPGERWLYLGAASGTTASHLADLVGPEGRVYAVERSPRTFARLLTLAARWPNVLPILADAREPRTYSALVPPVRGLYTDVAQPDQVGIVRANAELFLDTTGAAVVLALKTSSMGRHRTAAAHLAEAEGEVAQFVRRAPTVRLDPFHKGHFLLGGRVRLERPAVGRTRLVGSQPVSWSRAPPRARRRR